MIWGYSYSWPAMLWMFFWNLLWLALLGLAIWALVRWLIRATSRHPHAQTPASGPSAMEILRQRYARGEIDATTFEQMRERLEGRQEERATGR